MEKFQMSYNSQKEKLIISEYGRNIQNLIFYAKEIEDDKERQVFTEKVIELMHQMNPQSKSLAEYKERLWGHLFRIADYDIKVMPQSGELPEAKDYFLKPTVINYPANEKEFRHYGHFVQIMIKKAIEMEDGPKKEAFVRVIGSYMKLAYTTWNREHYVNDEIIKDDLKSLSKGLLDLSDDVALDKLANYARRKKRNHNQSRGRNPKGKRRR